MMLEREDTIKHLMAGRSRRLHELQKGNTPVTSENNSQDTFRITIGQRALRPCCNKSCRLRRTQSLQKARRVRGDEAFKSSAVDT